MLPVACLAACTDSTAGGDIAIPGKQVAVAFNTYLENGSATTRAFTGSINSATQLHEAGFGVFAYYTGDKLYTGDLMPDFIYNQHVTWQTATDVTGSTGWTYSPLKFWPNETGTDTGAQHRHRASFFAYAPFATIDMDELTHTGTFMTNDTTGITAVSPNSYKGDPWVSYKVATDSSQAAVDLLWGVGSTESNYRDANGDSVIIASGMPLLNLTRQRSGDAVRFRMKHALCRFGVNVTGDFPGLTVPVNPESGTIILVKSVTISGNFYSEGKLNLNNTSASTPLWEDCEFGNSDSTSTIVIDKRSITSSLRDVDYSVARNDTALWNHNCRMGGVNATTRYLLKAFDDNNAEGVSNRSYFMLIPNIPASGTQLKVTVDYTVQTVDSALVLSDGYSRQEYTTSAEQDIPTLEAGRTYTINLRLSMQGMTFNVESREWDDES